MTKDDALSKLQAEVFVQRALKNPRSPTSVLTFWFGVDYADQAAFNHMMLEGNSVLEMRELWFSTSVAFDAFCRPFRDTVRAVGRGEMTGADWATTVDGQMAQLVLCDQLSRTIFRGSEEAFAYDSTSLELARNLSANLLRDEAAVQAPLTGEFYPPYVVFLQTAFMHSERVEDHDELGRVVDYADTHAPPALRDWFDLMRSGGEAHTRVVARFGRYPHRNAARGRASTPEELAWLADVDNLPGWARSQAPKS